MSQTNAMWVLTYLYNNNGMASWCWEAAHALHEAGQPVLLVCSQDVQLPGSPDVEVLRYTPDSEPRKKSIAGKLSRLSARSSGFVGGLHSHLQERGIVPSAYLLNQSDLQDPRVSTPQYVVAWAYPVSLWGYLSKIGRLSRGGLVPFARTCFDVVGWWRKDWRAYRSATRVLAVSERLRDELISRHVRASVVHPGTYVRSEPQQDPAAHGPCKLLIVALDLEEPRKRVRFMIEALTLCPERNFHLTLVGQASDAFKKWVYSTDLAVTFTGQLTRHQVQDVMADHDIFLFGSCLDDWGYVQVEAMGQGLCVVAPNLSPFDEILGDQEMLFTPSSQEDFGKRVHSMINKSAAMKVYAWKRANRLFSRQAFGRSLLSVVSEEVVNV